LKDGLKRGIRKTTFSIHTCLKYQMSLTHVRDISIKETNGEMKI
jgi:hypothetical protein